MPKKPLPLESRLVKNPRYIGVLIEKEIYEILSQRAASMGDKLSKTVRNILNKAANEILENN